MRTLAILCLFCISVTAQIQPTLRKRQIVAPANHSLRLEWDRVNGATGYHLLQGGKSGTYTNIVILGNALTAKQTYTVTNLPNGKTYYFAVKAFNASEESGPSNEAFGIVKIRDVYEIQQAVILAPVSGGPWQIIKSQLPMLYTNTLPEFWIADNFTVTKK